MLLAFSALAWSVADGGSVARADRHLADWIHRHRVDDFDALWRALAVLGGGVVLGAAVAVMALLAWRSGRGRLALFVGVAFCGGEALSWALKAAIGRSRPPLADQVIHLTSPSFPSGHALAATAFSGALAVVLWRLPRSRWRTGGLWSSAGFAVAVGVSRLALDVHFLTDVLAGWALGAAWVMVCAALLRPLPRIGPWRTAGP